MNQIKNKPFIQIGANIGSDNFYEICKNYNPSKIILIEPFESLHASLSACYKDIPSEVYYESVCIVDNPNISTVNLYTPTGETSHASIMTIKDWADVCLRPVATVPATTISEIFSKYNISEIGLLYIDTEGNDARIIESINFDSVKINAIVYEHWGFTNEHYHESNYLNGLDGMNYIENKLTNIGYEVSFNEDFADKNHLAILTLPVDLN